jgi:hypothetical protein
VMERLKGYIRPIMYLLTFALWWSASFFFLRQLNQNTSMLEAD